MSPGERADLLWSCSQEIARLQDRDQVIDRALALSLRLTGGEVAILDLPDGAGQARREMAAGGAAADPALPERLRGLVSGAVLRAGLAQRHVDDGPGAREPRMAFLGVPLIVGGAVAGLIAVAAPAPGPSEDQVRSLEIHAAQVAAALRSLERERAASIRTLAGITRRLARTLEVDELLDSMVEEAAALVDAESGFACTRTGSGLRARRYFDRGTWVPFERTFLEGEGSAHPSLRAREAVTLNGPRDPRVDAELRRRFAVRNAVVAPVLDGAGALLGLLQADNKRHGAGFGRGDAQAIAAVARAASFAIQNVLGQGRILEAERARIRVLSQLAAAHEEERRRIAEDIHADSLQVLDAALLRLEMLSQRTADAAQAGQVAEVRAAVAEAENRLRHLLFDLRPPAIEAPDGLRWALQEHLERLERRVGLTWKLDVRVSPDLPIPTRLVVFRIAQEAVANVVKHARASIVRIQVREDEDGVHARIEDDGRGFEVGNSLSPPGHFGLTEMHGRAELAGGWLHLRAGPESGTEVTFWIPRPEYVE